MKVKRYTESEIRAILKEADGSDGIDAACRKYNVTDVTLHRWREKYGRMEEAGDSVESARIASLEAENSRLKRLLSKQALDLAMLRGALGRRV